MHRSEMFLVFMCTYLINAIVINGASEDENFLSNINRDTSNVSMLNDAFETCFNDNANGESLSDDTNDHSRSLIRGSHKFSLELLKFLSNFESKDSSEGLLISPFSVWSALIATYMGSRGDTEREIKQVLQIEDIPKPAVGMSYQGLQLWYQIKKNASTSNNKKYSYAAANRIFVNEKMKLNECIRDHFANEIVSLDFSDGSAAAANINNWVADLTMGKIKELVSANSLSPWTQIVIANAVYFKSQWLYKFDEAKNERKDFQVTPTETIQLSFMSQTGNFMYGVNERLRATIVDLPYANQQFSMTIILPDHTRGLDSLIKMIKPDDLYDIFGNVFDDEVYVSIPRFKTEQEFELAGPLYSMGVKKLFDPRYADLTGFFDTPSNKSASNDSALSQRGATINSVIHKASITVNEEGTEAAAATAFLMARSGRPAFPTRFVADRPFMYMIRDTNTNIILFIGAVRRPNQS